MYSDAVPTPQGSSVTERIAATALEGAAAHAVARAQAEGCVTEVLVDGRAVARIVPVDRPAIRPPVQPKEGHVFGLETRIKMRGGGSILDVLREQRR